MVLTTALAGTVGAGLLSLATIPAHAGSDVEIGPASKGELASPWPP
jgi:hypothetical protein